MAIVCGGYAAPLTFNVIVTGDSPVAKENLLPRSKVAAETDNIDSFDVHPANRWETSETGGITSSITQGNLRIEATENQDYFMERQLFEPDGEVDYRYGVDYQNDSQIATVDGTFNNFNDEWFDDTFGDISDWSEGDYEGWVSNDTLSLFADHYLKILNDDGTYYYKTFESLFDGHLPDPRSIPAQAIQIPYSFSDENNTYLQQFIIPEGQEWLLSYLAFNLGQYDGVFPCTNIGWCLPDPLGEGTEHAYDQSGATKTLITPINELFPSYGQLFEVPQGEVWNITSSGTWFYYASANGHDFFVYDSEYAASQALASRVTSAMNGAGRGRPQLRTRRA